jgi:hypothetical protein
MLSVNQDTTKNIKDTSEDLGIVIKDTNISISYTKTNKLITALYMVTDIIDKDEPLRNKLRTLGVEIISDINIDPTKVYSKIHQIMSFLDIGSAISIISKMNYSILRKEFVELSQSIKESTDKVLNLDKQINLTDFFNEEFSVVKNLTTAEDIAIKDMEMHKGHTRIGVQKGSTLLKALSNKNLSKTTKYDFELLKKERRFNIVKVIKNSSDGATIKDIHTKINSSDSGATFCSEKTLQRELMSMISDGVLYKTGEKRWSKYFLKMSEFSR